MAKTEERKEIERIIASAKWNPKIPQRLKVKAIKAVLALKKRKQNNP